MGTFLHCRGFRCIFNYSVALQTVISTALHSEHFYVMRPQNYNGRGMRCICLNEQAFVKSTDILQRFFSIY